MGKFKIDLNSLVLELDEKKFLNGNKIDSTKLAELIVENLEASKISVKSISRVKEGFEIDTDLYVGKVVKVTRKDKPIHTVIYKVNPKTCSVAVDGAEYNYPKGAIYVADNDWVDKLAKGKLVEVDFKGVVMPLFGNVYKFNDLKRGIKDKLVVMTKETATNCIFYEVRVGKTKNLEKFTIPHDALNHFLSV